jgi:HAD superfamily hydrolase (TIGR01549 family)
MVRCVLFDLDGTLIESSALYAACIEAALAGELSSSQSFDSITDLRRATAERAFLVDWLGEEVGTRVHGRLCDVYEARAGELLGGLYKGVAELLEGLRVSGMPMGIVSGKSRRAFAATCASMEVPDVFDVVVLEDDVSAPKPDPAGLLRALAALGAKASETVYVGDTLADLEAARQAGMVGACALWSRSDDERRRISAGLTNDVWALHAPKELAARLFL